jgi:hypothetical protein
MRGRGTGLTFIKGDFLIFSFHVRYSTLLYLPPLTVSEDAGIEPRTVAKTALAVSRSNHALG